MSDIRKTPQNGAQPPRRASQGVSQSNRPPVRNTQESPAQRPAPTNRPHPTAGRITPTDRAAYALSERRRYIAEKKKARKTGIIAFFSVFLSLCLIFGILTYIFLKPEAPVKEDTVITFMIEGAKNYTLPEEDAFINGTLYVDFDPISKLCGFTAVGTSDGISYIYTDASGIEQRIDFTYNDQNVYINGTGFSMNALAIKSEGSVKIPYTFLNQAIIGINAEFDENVLNVTRDKTTGSRPDSPIYEEIILINQPSKPIDPPNIPEEEIIPTDLGFISDLSAYEQYMNPEDRDAYLVLINKQNPVDQNFAPDDLVYVPQEFAVYSGEYQARMREIAAKALTAMLTEAKNYGVNDVKLTHGYRNYWTQNYLFTTYIDEEMAKGYSYEQAKAIVETYSAPPGTSEHQSGLCADMHNVYFTNKELEDFEYTEAYEWLRDNCWKFGFILRFPEGKEEITGFQFECWHYRFVGRYHAYKIHSQGLCLEEYLELLANEAN